MEPEVVAVSEITAATISLTIKNILGLYRRIYSEPVVVRGIPWVIYVHPQEDKVSRTTTLGVYLHRQKGSEETSPADWEYKVTMTMKLLAQKENCANKISGPSTSIFSPATPCWGCAKLISWMNMVCPENGFLLNDSIRLEVDIRVHPHTGIPSGQARNVTEVGKVENDPVAQPSPRDLGRSGTVAGEVSDSSKSVAVSSDAHTSKKSKLNDASEDVPQASKSVWGMD